MFRVNNKDIRTMSEALLDIKDTNFVKKYSRNNQVFVHFQTFLKKFVSRWGNRSIGRAY